MKTEDAESSKGRPKRTYRFAPKVRTGCVTCRARRVKCDESKPGCRRCGNFGVECGGYGPQKGCEKDISVPSTAIIKSLRESVKSKVPTNTQCSLILSPRPSYGTYQEQRALSFYLSTVAATISEFSSPNFWKILIPQASWVHPGVKHALVAMTWRQMHLRSVRSDSTQPDNTSIWHYNRSIYHLRLQAPTIEVTLLACFLLFTYENTDANFIVARQHIKSGLKIIKEWQLRGGNKLSRDDIMSEEIIPRFTEGLAFLQACLSGQPFLPGAALKNSSMPISHLLDKEKLSESEMDAEAEACIPSPLQTAGTTRDGLFTSFSEACTSLSSCILQTALGHSTRTSTLTPLLLRWKRTLSSSLSSFSSTDPYSLRLLQVHFLTCRTIGATLHWGPNDAATAYDSYISDFNFMIAEMEVLLLQPDLLGCSDISTTLGFIPPVFLIALRCRDLHIRTRALKLLHQMQRKEGRWTSSVAARIVEAAMMWEARQLDAFRFPYCNESEVVVNASVDSDLPQLPQRGSQSLCHRSSIASATRSRRRLGRVNVELIGDDSNDVKASQRAIFLASAVDNSNPAPQPDLAMAAAAAAAAEEEQINVTLSMEDIELVEWPILDLLDAHGYQDLSRQGLR